MAPTTRLTRAQARRAEAHQTSTSTSAATPSPRSGRVSKKTAQVVKVTAETPRQRTRRAAKNKKALEHAVAEGSASDTASNQQSDAEDAQRGQDILRKIINARDEALRPTKRISAVQETENVAMDMEAENAPAPLTPSSSMAAPSTPGPSTDLATLDREAPPTTGGWGLKSLFSRIATPFTSYFSPSKPAPAPAVAPATAPPAPLAAHEADELAATLAMTPTRQPRRRTKTPGTASTTSTSNRTGKSNRTTRSTTTTGRRKSTPVVQKTPDEEREIINKALEGIPSSERKVARKWLKDNLKKIDFSKINVDDDATATLGDKRKRLPEGIKIKDLEHIPARKPWQPQGTFSFGLDDFEDEEADVPDYYLIDRLANHPEEPVSKRRKTAHIFDSHGNSSSQRDLHPRPSTVPAPMFAIRSEQEQPRGNVFSQSQSQSQQQDDDMYEAPEVLSEDERAAREKQFRRNGHAPGFGFCMPEYSEEDSMSDLSEEPTVTEETNQPWTMQPPPAPTMSHATLPTPLTSTPSVPAIREPASVDPVKIARDRALKHTPAKPSRLRELSVPSPSLDSDAGNESLLRQTPQTTMKAISRVATPIYSFPDAQTLGDDGPVVEAAVKAHIEHADFHANSLKAFPIPHEVTDWSDEEAESPSDNVFPDGSNALFPNELEQNDGYD